MVVRAILTNPMILNQLYALPCDPIPLSKLLLHAESIVDTQQQVAKQRGLPYGSDEVLALLAGALDHTSPYKYYISHIINSKTLRPIQCVI
jgi:hypothetical protein